MVGRISVVEHGLIGISESQTIANLIASLVARNKLFDAEKRPGSKPSPIVWVSTSMNWCSTCMVGSVPGSACCRINWAGTCCQPERAPVGDGAARCSIDGLAGQLQLTATGRPGAGCGFSVP